MFTLMGDPQNPQYPNPALQRVESMYTGMGRGGGLDISRGLAQSRVSGPAAEQIKLAMQDQSKINAAAGKTNYNLARGQMAYDLQTKALNAQQQFQMANSQQGSSLLMQLLSPFMGSLMNQA